MRGIIAIAIPIFVLCFLAQYFLAIQWGWFRPTVGAQNDWGDLWLPAIVLGLSLYATSMRLMRSSVIDTLNQDWVRTAYSKGLSRSRVIPVHVLRNSLIPVVTFIGADLGALAAATAARSGADGCVVGAETARANGGELTTCVDEGGGVFRATVTVPFTPIVPADVGPASAVARAGPTG